LSQMRKVDGQVIGGAMHDRRCGEARLSAPLKEEFWPHRAAGGITKNKMSTFKPTTEKQFAHLAEELRRVIDTAIDPGYFPPGMHTPEEEQFIRQEVAHLLADKH